MGRQRESEWVYVWYLQRKKSLQDIWKRFVKDLKNTHLINIWNVLCVEGNYLTIQRFKVTRNWRDIWHLTSDIWHLFELLWQRVSVNISIFIWHLTSDLWLLTSDIWHLTSDIWPLTLIWHWTFELIWHLTFDMTEGTDNHDAYSSISLWPLFRQTTPQIITFFLIYLTLHNMFRLSGPDHMHLLTEQNRRASLKFYFHFRKWK